MVELKVEIEIPVRELLASVWSHSPSHTSRPTPWGLYPKHAASYHASVFTSPAWSRPLPSLPRLVHRVSNWSPCLDLCPLPSLCYTAAKEILFICKLIQAPNSFLSHFQSKASLGNSPWDPPPSGPCSALLSFWSHLLLLPTARSSWAHWPLRSSRVREQAPAAECLHYFCREHSSLDIKALLSPFFQSPAQVSSSQRSLPHHALLDRNPQPCTLHPTS